MAVRKVDDCVQDSTSTLAVAGSENSYFGGKEFKPYHWHAMVKTERHMRNLDDIEISDKHHYGDLGIRWHFFDKLRPMGIPFRKFTSMPHHLGTYHDESHPFYKRIVEIRKKMVRTASMDYDAIMFYIRDLIFTSIDHFSKNIVEAMMILIGVVLFAMMYIGYQDQVHTTQQAFAQVAQVQQQATDTMLKLQIAEAKQKGTEIVLTQSVSFNTELQKQMVSMMETQRQLTEQLAQMSADNQKLQLQIKANRIKSKRFSSHPNLSVQH